MCTPPRSRKITGCEQFNVYIKTCCFVAFYDQELEPMEKELRVQRKWKAHEVINTGQEFSTTDVRSRYGISVLPELCW
jgi:hypothetical protein